MSPIVPSTSRHGILSTTDMINKLTQGHLSLIGYTTTPCRAILEREVIAMAWGLEMFFVVKITLLYFGKSQQGIK